MTRAYALLDEAQIPAVKCIVKLLESKNELIRLKAAGEILAKRIPDLTQDTGERVPTVINVIRMYREQVPS